MQARRDERFWLLPLIQDPLLWRVVPPPRGPPGGWAGWPTHLAVVHRAQPILHRNRNVRRCDARTRRDVRGCREIDGRSAGRNDLLDPRRTDLIVPFDAIDCDGATEVPTVLGV